MADDRTAFYIDILAKMTGSDTAVANVATLGDKMLAGGAAVADFERAIASMSGAIEDSSAVVKTTSDALSVGETKYRQLEASADRAAKAVERMAASGKSGDAFARRQGEAVVKAEQAAVALKAEASAIDALKAKAGAAAAQHDALTKGLKNVKAAADQAAKAEAAAKGTGSLREIASGLRGIGGPAGMAGEKLAGLGEAFHKLAAGIGGAGLYVAVAVAIVAIATAAIAATAAVGKWAVTLADANRTQMLLSAGVAHSVAGGEQLDKTIGLLADVVPQSREELLAMAGDLSKTGLRGKELSGALEDAAVKAAQLKWGPDFAKQMLSLDVQSRRLHANIAGTFGGLHIEGLLGGFQTLVALFDSSTSSGRALKFLFETLFQPVIDAVAEAMPKVERFFLQGEILALKAYIALKPYHDQIAAVGKALLIGAAVIAGVLLVAVVAVVGAVLLLVAAIGALVYGLYEIDAAIVGAVKGAFDWLNDQATKMGELGANMVMGMVEGITGAAGRVVEAITGVVSGAVKAAEHLLGIGSPSKLFMDMGDMTALGFSAGIEGGTGDAQGAIEALVAPPQRPGAGRASASSNSVTINITVDGRGESEDGLAQKIASAVRDLFETDALMLGAGEEPA